MTAVIEFLKHFGEDFFIQTFDDKKKGNRAALSERRINTPEELPKYIPGLKKLNEEQNAGIYFCVNDLGTNKRRSSDNVVSVRAFFVDLDGSPLEPLLKWHLQPNFVVQTSLDRYHAYWLLDDNYPAALKLFKPIQRWLADKFNGDKSVNDLGRVMRLPSFNNMKHEPFMVTFKQLRPQPYKLEEITNAYEHSKADNDTGAVERSRDAALDNVVLPPGFDIALLSADAGRGGIKNMVADLAFSADRLRGALLSISADDYEVWLRVGMALQGAAMREDAELSKDEAFEWWDSWSQTSPKYDDAIMDEKWEGLQARGEVGLGTVFELAQQHGWNGRGAKSWSIDEFITKERERLKPVAKVKIDMTTPEGRRQAARLGIK
jgi:hypothetical protein